MRNLITAAVFSLAACAVGPDYRAATAPGEIGYVDEPIANAPGAHRVIYTGGPRMGLLRVRDFALQRAAEVTVANGGDWFAVTTEDTVTTEDELGGVTVEDTGAGAGQNCDIHGCTPIVESYRAHSVSAPAATNRVHTVILEIAVKTGAVPSGEDEAYDAREVLASIRG